MNRLFMIGITLLSVTLTACTYEYVDHGRTSVYHEDQDGHKTLTITDHGTTETITVDGLSKRKIRRIIAPQMPGDTEMTPVQFEYRYEYDFDLYDVNGNFVDTLVVESFDDFTDMIPLIFSLGGLPAPSQDAIDDFSAEMSQFWINPETDWHRFN